MDMVDALNADGDGDKSRPPGTGAEVRPDAMWGGRFAVGPDAVMRAINRSFDTDQRLWREDIAGSRAHAAMLVACGILSQDDGAAIDAGLCALADAFEADGVPDDPVAEDIHMAIEAMLAARIGPVAGRLHTARSRNDQVATDLRLWLRGASRATGQAITALIAALVDQADAHAATVMPGFTHLQVAQPVTLGHHLLAYAEMLARDHGRLTDARDRADECPLGAAALAGTGFPIDRHQTARALGFARPMANSIDAVSARDFAIEHLGALMTMGLHLSRLAEEIILWSSQPFGFIVPDDRWSTGSSIMPQKRNPDAAELVRAKAAELMAAHQRMAGIVKALPLTYAKDLQDDKATLFGAHDTAMLCLAAMTGMIRTLAPRAERMAMLAASGHSTATDLADALVRDHGVPFRQAHHIVGACVARADALGVDLSDLPLSEAAAIDPRVDAAMLGALTIEASVAMRTSYGGTAPAGVRMRIADWRAWLARADGEHAACSAVTGGCT